MNDPREPILTRVLLVTGFCAVLFIPLLAYGCGPEWARWDAAQAVMAHERGDVDGAIEQLTAAVEKSPRDPSLKLSLAEKLIESSQPFRAERVCDEILKRFPDHDAALIRKANSQQSQGNFVKALATFKQRAKARSWLISDSFHKLNERAYFRALANRELPYAKEDIDAAIAKVAQQRLGALEHSVSIRVRSLVVSALVGRKIGMADVAIDRLTPRINALRIKTHEIKLELNAAIIQQSSQQFPPVKEDTLHYNAMRANVWVVEKELALLLTTRALCYQDLSDQDPSNIQYCDQDRAEVRSLGLDADKIVAKLPGDNECISELLDSHSLLDTRGFIVSRLSDSPSDVDSNGLPMLKNREGLNEALVDFNQAIFAFQVFANSLGTEVHNHIENTLDIAIMKLRIPRSKAVLLYHRMLLLEKIGPADAAAKDRESIIELGFEPGWHLF